MNYGINNASMFDSTAHTTGGLPHIVDLLFEAYKTNVEGRRQARIRSNLPAPKSLEEALKLAPATDFVKFATAYLQENRPVQMFPVDMNHGIMLSNNVRCVISPGCEVRGTMEPSGAVGVMHGTSQPGLGGVEAEGGIKVI